MSEQLSRATGPAYVTSISLIDLGQSVSMDGSSFRDTEGYASVISIVPDNGMMTSMLHWGAVMSHTSSLTFSTVTFPRR